MPTAEKAKVSDTTMVNKLKRLVYKTNPSLHTKPLTLIPIASKLLICY